jgi:AraC-like DNA-binding protein
MPTAMICYDGGDRISDLIRSLSNLDGWDIHSQNIQTSSVKNIQIDFTALDLHFLIFTSQLNHKSLQELKIIRTNNPWTTIIYYNSLLVNQQFLKLSELGINSCIVGIDRKKNLIEYLHKLWLKHWKRIPEDIYPNSNDRTAPRAKKIIKYLENRPVTECTTGKISEHLNISKSHFRAEFKSHFGINFREFKQRLFNHYESELLLSNKYKPSDICKILNYKYIANYSRSFKTRHGDCWRNLHVSN